MCSPPQAAPGGPQPAKRRTGATDAAQEKDLAAAKRYKAGDHVPKGADQAIWASLFTSASVGARRADTFTARALSFHR